MIIFSAHLRQLVFIDDPDKELKGTKKVFMIIAGTNLYLSMYFLTIFPIE